MNGKYITFKREDWDQLCTGGQSIYPQRLSEIGRQKEVDDAVVIRRKDAFASAALHTYANSIGVAAKCIGMLAPEVSTRLLNIADYFHTQAVLSDDTDTRLPD